MSFQPQPDQCPVTDLASVPNPLGEGNYIKCVLWWRYS